MKEIAREAMEEDEPMKLKDYFAVMELVEHFRACAKTIYRRLWAKGIQAYKVGQQWRIAKNLIWYER